MNHTLLEISAHHEAGHVLAEILLGAIIREVEINSDGSGGVCGSHKGNFGMGISPEHFRSKQSVLIYLAGPCAAHKLQGFCRSYEYLHDAPKAMMFLQIKGWKPPYSNYSNDAFFREYSGDAKRFVNHEIRWQMITTLAKMLMKKRRVSGQVAVKFFEDETEKLPPSEQMELMFPEDGLGGDQLSFEKHGE